MSDSLTEEQIQEAERQRAEAEEERNRREELRRIGEGGPEQHIPGNVLPGRVEAEEERVANEARRADLRRFYAKMATTVAFPLAFIALIPALVGLYLLDQEVDRRTTANRALAVQGAEAHDALCILKSDIQDRADRTEAFVNNIKKGLRSPLPGITTEELERSVAQQRETLEGLASLRCEN